MRAVLRALRTFVALLRRPDLWGTAVATAIRFVPDRWWRRGPMPAREYLDYRGNGIYGMPLSEVPPADLIHYLEWCKAFPGPIS